MLDGEFFEAAWQLLEAVLFSPPASSTRPADLNEDATLLSEREQRLARQIQDRRGVSAAVAEDLVRWCRTQSSGSQS